MDRNFWWYIRAFAQLKKYAFLENSWMLDVVICICFELGLARCLHLPSTPSHGSCSRRFFSWLMCHLIWTWITGVCVHFPHERYKVSIERSKLCRIDVSNAIIVYQSMHEIHTRAIQQKNKMSFSCATLLSNICWILFFVDFTFLMAFLFDKPIDARLTSQAWSPFPFSSFLFKWIDHYDYNMAVIAAIICADEFVCFLKKIFIRN